MSKKEEEKKVTQPIDYVPSESVKAVQDALNTHLATKTESPWAKQMETALQNLLQRTPFSYDMGADKLYHQYKNQYQNQADLAMRDTVGQVAALSGGYGNSFAQIAGQQAYQQQMGQLNNVIPELYNLAYSKYAHEGDDLLTRYSLLAAQDEAHKKEWSTERDRLQSLYDTALSRDYDQHLDQVAQDRWQSEMDGGFSDLFGSSDLLGSSELSSGEDYAALALRLAELNDSEKLEQIAALTNAGTLSPTQAAILMNLFGLSLK